MTVAIVHHRPSELQAHHLALVAAFRAAFTIDTAEASSYVANIYRHASRPDFRFFAARDGGKRGTLLGFAYGYTSLPGQWYHDSLAPVLGPEQSARWLTGAYEFVEFGVVPEARCRGIGSRLHDTTFAGLPHRAAILSTPVGNDVAIGFYRRRGWQTLLEHFVFPGGEQPFLIMGRALP
jgi:ribosomal protein S18 acetylase RimI-like enzyme